MKNLKKEIQIELLEEAMEFILGLNEKIQQKFLKSFDKTEAGLKGPWFEKLRTKKVFSSSKRGTVINSIEFLHSGIVTPNLKR